MLFRVLVTYDGEIEALARWVIGLCETKLANDDEFKLVANGVTSSPVSGTHLEVVLRLLEAPTQASRTLIVLCLADGLSEQGQANISGVKKFVDGEMASTRGAAGLSMQIINAKKNPEGVYTHTFYTKEMPLSSIESNLLMTLRNKLRDKEGRRNKADKNDEMRPEVHLVPKHEQMEQEKEEMDGEQKTKEQEARVDAINKAIMDANLDEPGDATTPPTSPPLVPQAPPTTAANFPAVGPTCWNLVEATESDLKWIESEFKQRLVEGSGEFWWRIGVDALGTPRGLSEVDFEKNMEILSKIAEGISCKVTIIAKKSVKKDFDCAELLVRCNGEENYIDMRIAICGNVDSGKSTLVGVLTRGTLDNGRGLVRAKVFRHRHEAETGRTSSISEQLIGYDGEGHLVNYHDFQHETEAESTHRQVSTKDLCDRSAKIFTLYDLAGHERYLKTTVLGMTGSLPDYACIVISANNGVQRMTKEHLGLCIALQIPIFVVVTRIDLPNEQVTKHTVDSIHKILKLPGVKKIPYPVKTEESAVIAAKNIRADRISPIFMVSNVTGEGLGLLQKFINLLPMRKDWHAVEQEPAEIIIDSTFFVQGVGTVVGGIVTKGVVHTNSSMLLGPLSNGTFKPVQIRSINVKDVPMDEVRAGSSAAFALKRERRSDIRKGMALVSPNTKPSPAASWTFDAEVLVLFHSTTIKSNYQPVVHCHTIRQSAAITLTDVNECLRTGDKAIVRFRFLYRPEYIRPEQKIIFREGRTKGVGTVKVVYRDGVQSSADDRGGTA